MSSFIHLHVHTQYSLLESAVHIKNLITKTKEFGMDSVAITDHGNMYGAVDFYLAAKAADIKPIIGCEIYYTSGSRLQKPVSTRSKKIAPTEAEIEHQKNYRLVLLCQNEKGYHNLCEIVTRAFSEGFHFKPRADYELLEKYNDGLFALSAGLKGEVAWNAVASKNERSEEAAKRLQSIFKDRFYLEVQENGLPAQSIANKTIVDLSKKLSIPLVAGCDVHYLTQDQGPAHEVLMCIAAGRNIDDSKGIRLATDEFWFKDAATVEKQFHWAPEAISNTKIIADQCKFSFKLKDEKGRQIYHLPDYRPEQWADENVEKPAYLHNQVALAEQIKDRFSAEKFLRILSQEGLKKRFKKIAEAHTLRNAKLKEANPAAVLQSTEELQTVYEKRLEQELAMIIQTGFSGYFLVVADFIGFAKSVNIPVGPGRGSGAGSIVAYALEITDIDPIPYNLLFERFINPERISMPDFDVDFCQERRSEVINYVVQKYGKDKVSQIITFGKLLARGVIRDVGRVLNVPFSEVDMLAKLVPEELGITLNEAFEKEPKLRELTEKDGRIAKLFEYARLLEGLSRHASVHAAGVVITNRPLVEYGPLMTGKEGEAVVQYDKDFAEKIGLVKFDFLGLKTLTVIANALQFVHATQRAKGVAEADLLRLEDVSLDDPQVYKLISSGDTDGVFQLESSGMKDLCQRVIPSNLEDITAINALYRPGPLNSGMVDDYINRKHGKTEVVYEIPELKDILEETYGVIVYQEQVMRVARVLAGYSLGEADILRRAMGKKKPEEMAKQRDKFIEGSQKNGISKEKANGLFDLLAKFAEYGFNKSHSAAYGVLSFQTAYLKTYYPAEFMAALMATEMDDTEKMSYYIADSKNHGIEILPPDVNSSQKTFSVVDLNGKQAIRFGLEAIKGVGGVAVDSILSERNEKGPFVHFVDFVKRARKANKKVIESLVSAGAFDSIAEENRATLLHSLERVSAHAEKIQEQSDLGQVSLFESYEPQGFKMEVSTEHLFEKVPDWTESKKLQLEKQLVGFYVSGHPLEKWWPVAKDFVHGDLSWIKSEFERKKLLPLEQRGVIPPKKPGSYRNEGPRWDVVTVALVGSFREIITKKGTKMAFIEIEDAKTKVEAICFPESYEQNQQFLKASIEESLPFIISGNVGIEEETVKFFIRSMERIEDYQKKRVQSVVFQLEPAATNTEKLAQLRGILIRHRGQCPAYLEYKGAVDGTSFSSRHLLPKELMLTPTADLAAEVNQLFGRDVVRFL